MTRYQITSEPFAFPTPAASCNGSLFAWLRIAILVILCLMQCACFAWKHHESMASSDGTTKHGTIEFTVEARASRYDLAKSWAPWSLWFEAHDKSSPAKEFSVSDITVEIDGKTYSYTEPVYSTNRAGGSTRTGAFIPLPEKSSTEAIVRFRATIKGRQPIHIRRTVRFQIETETGIIWFNPALDITHSSPGFPSGESSQVRVAS